MTLDSIVRELTAASINAYSSNIECNVISAGNKVNDRVKSVLLTNIKRKESVWILAEAITKEAILAYCFVGREKIPDEKAVIARPITAVYNALTKFMTKSLVPPYTGV